MTIAHLLTPMTEVAWLSTADTVRDAFVHMESHELGAAPLVDRDGRYAGTLTEADLRRHVAGRADRATAFAMPLSNVLRRVDNPAVGVDCDLESVLAHATAHRFVPVVDDRGRLIGIVDRRRVLATRLPSAA